MYILHEITVSFGFLSLYIVDYIVTMPIIKPHVTPYLINLSSSTQIAAIPGDMALLCVNFTASRYLSLQFLYLTKLIEEGRINLVGV